MPYGFIIVYTMLINEYVIKVGFSLITTKYSLLTDGGNF